MGPPGASPPARAALRDSGKEEDEDGGEEGALPPHAGPRAPAPQGAISAKSPNKGGGASPRWGVEQDGPRSLSPGGAACAPGGPWQLGGGLCPEQSRG